ncbi:MAG: hypothetical protein GC189_05785 [Alphaproteobacteria bacterium]|nr:hypothetical protein [Alphaproteobacteria bacterium]
MRFEVRSSDARGASSLQESLAEAGFEAAAHIGLDAWSNPRGTDVIVTDARGGLRAAALAWTTTAPPVLLSLAAAEADAPPPPGKDHTPGVDGWIMADGPSQLRARQIEAHVRAAVAADEARRRRRTADALGVARPIPAAPRRLKALFIGAANPFFLALEQALGAHGGIVSAAFSSFSGFDHLHDEQFDAVVLNGVSDPATAVALCAALRRNANLHAMPSLVLAAHGDAATRAAAVQRGASAVATDKTPDATAVGWLFDAIRRERRRRAAETELRDLRDGMGDPRTGLFRADAFKTHLAALLQDHQDAGRPVSIAALRLCLAPGASSAPRDAWLRAFEEIASLSVRLVRDADCGATFGDDALVFALPATSHAGARRTAERIAAVCECSAFAAGDGDVGPLVFEQSVIEAHPGEGAAACLGRVCAPFEPMRARA